MTGATGIAGSDAGKKSGGNKGGTPTGGISKAGRGGSITATGNGSTGNAAVGAVTDHTSARRPRSVNIKETWTKTRRRPPFGEEFQPRRRLKRPQAAHSGRLHRVWAHAAVIGPEREKRCLGKRRRDKAKDELVSVETEAEFHAAVNSGADVELTHELAEKIGLMVEDVGTLEDIKAAKFDPYN